MKIKMLALDLDGTLLNDERTISSKNMEAIIKAIKKGVTVVPATGRPPKGIPPELINIQGIRYAVTMNGASVLDLADNKVLYRDALNMNTVVNLLDTLVEHEGLLDVYYYDKCYTTQKGFDMLDTIALPKNFLKYVRETRTPVNDIISFVKEKDIAADKVNMIFKDISVRDKLWGELRTDKELAITSSVASNLEINARNVNKGEGLRQLGILLNHELEEIMAIGDADNDYLMIRNVGLGVAMENAKDSIKQVADFVTLSNEENGVAYAIENFLLNNE